jgi:hypothetical protein
MLQLEGLPPSQEGLSPLTRYIRQHIVAEWHTFTTQKTRDILTSAAAKGGHPTFWSVRHQNSILISLWPFYAVHGEKNMGVPLINQIRTLSTVLPFDPDRRTALCVHVSLKII